MQSRSFLLLAILALTYVVGFPSTGRAQDQREVLTELRSHQYLFFLGEECRMYLRVPEKEVAADALVQVHSLDVIRKFTQKGVLSFPDMKLKCDGITYLVPPHKVMVLGERPKKAKLSVLTAPDPNGSGNVELLITYRSNPGQDTVWMCKVADRPKGIEDVDASGERNGSEGKLDVILRNTTDTPYILKPEFFNNLPTTENWPEIIIPPANAK